LAARHRFIVTIEENVITGGFGSAVLEFLHATGNTPPRVHRLGVPAHFVEHSPQAVLRKQYHLDAEGIAQEIRTALSHGKGATR
jgi:1-deoxy-D-xylulose-5-phosphate synthase